MKGNTERIRLYRPECFILGSEIADIIMPDCKADILVKGKTAYIHKDTLGTLLINGRTVQQDIILLEDGDILTIGNTRVILIKNAILIEGKLDEIYTELPVIKDSGNPFEEFPKYKRSPRIIKRVQEEKIQLEKPKELMDRKKGGLVQLILPPIIMICITIAISIIMKRGLFVIMAVAGTGMSLIVSIMRYFSERKELNENAILREKIYKQYLLRKRKEIYQAYCREKEAYEYNYPSISEIEKMITEYHSRIYERNYHDEDFLKVSLGSERTHTKLQIQLKLDELKTKTDILEDEAKAIQREFSVIEKPVVVDLKNAHLGLVGEKSVIHEQLKALICQLTFFHSYHDLEIIVIYDEVYQEDFQWMRWYPHFKIHAVNCTSMINSENKRDQILGSLYQILKDRKQREEESKKESTYLPHFLFIIDEPKWIMDHSIMEYLEKEGYNLGFSIIYTSHLRANLPENIGTIAMLENSEEGMLLIEERQEKQERFKLHNLQGVSLEWMRERKKKLADAVVQNFEVYNQVADEKIKAIVLVIDNYDVVKELGYEAEEFFQKVSRDGYGLGIFVVATATRSNSMKYSTYNNFKNKIAGYMFDESEINLIVGRSAYKQSEIKGRALLKQDNLISVMQIYSMVGFETELEYNRKIETLIQKIDNLYPGEKAPRIPVLPENLLYTDMEEYPHTEQDIYVGLEKEMVHACGFRLEHTPFTILGESAKGKTNVLKIILEQITGRGQIYLADSRSMELYSYKKRTEEGIVYIENTAMVPFLIEALKDEIARRNQKVREELEKNPLLNPKEICRGLRPFILLVDDWDNFVEMTKAQAVTLAPLLNEAAGVGISIILTAHSGKMKGFDEVTKFAKNTTEGLLLGNLGTTAMFPVNSAKELPQFKDGLLFHNGAYIRVRIPKY